MRRFACLLALVPLLGIAAPARADEYVFQSSWQVSTGFSATPDLRGIDVFPGSWIYLTDGANDTIHRYAQSATYTGSIGLPGIGNGNLDNPVGIATDGVGSVYVVDQANHRIEKFSSSGNFVTAWGSAGTANGQFTTPYGIALDVVGNVYVTDSALDRVQKFDQNGNFVTAWGTTGSGDGQFTSPEGIAVGPGGNVYVGESGANKRIQKFTSSGAFVAKWGGPGSGPGQLSAASGLATDAAGDVYVADPGNHRVQRFAPTGTFVEEIGEAGGQFGSLATPVDVAVDGPNVYAVDRSNHYVYRYVKGGQVIVTLDTVPDGGAVQFSLGGGLSPTSMYLTDNGNNTGSAAAPAGSGYSVTESSAPGYRQTAATCSDGSAPSNISLSTGEIVNCTFTYKRLPQLTVVQRSQPTDPQDFTFHAGGGLSPATFVLDDDGFGGTSTTFNSVEPGTYSMSQDTPAGWNAAQVSCSDGSSPSAIDLSLGESVTCTFTNRSTDAALVLFRVDTQPDSSQIFRFTGLRFPVFLNDDGVGTPGSLTDPPNEGGMYMHPGTYKLREDFVNGWQLTSASCSDGSPVWALDLQANENVTCTFVNQAGPTGQVVVKLDSDPDDPQLITFNTSGGLNGVQGPPTFQLRDPGNSTAPSSGTFQVPAGSGYGVSEQVPAGWDATPTCSDGSPVSNIDVSSGEVVTCTFLTRKRGSLTIKQDTEPDNPQDFQYTASGGLSPSSFTLDDDGDDSNGTSSTRTFSGIPAGTYSLTQQGVPGWSTYIRSCSNGSTIDQIVVKGGEDVTCTLRNTRPGSPAPASSLGAGGVKQNPNGSGSWAQAISANGRYVVFETYASLDPADTDTRRDVYWRDLRTGEVRLVDRASGANGAKADYDSEDPDVSADGRYVAFSSGANNLDPDDCCDTQHDYDVYRRDMVANVTTLVSRTYPGSGSYIAQWGGSPSISSDGRYIAFSSRSRDLTPDPENDIDEEDIFVRDMVAGTTTLASRATGATGADSNHFAWYPSISGNGRYVAFQSPSTNLDPADTDTIWDIFVRDTVANTTTLVSRASGPSGQKGSGYSSIGKMSGDGRYVAFFTDSSLDPGDSGGPDVYVRDMQTFSTVLATPGTGTAGSYDPARLSLSEDGRYVAYDAISSGKSSVYLRDLQSQTTTFVSRPSGSFGEANRDANRPSVASGGRFVSFLSDATNLASDDNGAFPDVDLFVRDTQDQVTSLESRKSPTYPRPKAATPIYATLVPAYDDCVSPNRAHAPSLSFGSCAPPAQSSPRVTMGTPDANGAPAKGVASLKTIVAIGNPSNPAEDADVQFTTSVTDVRNTSGLSDYTGELEVRIPLQVTDRINYPPTGGQGPGTTAPFDLSFAVPCSATGDATVGSSCDLVTTADSLMPGAVIESSRGVWAYGQVQVYDGGPDSDADTQSGNSPFLRQGVFVP